MKRFFYLLLATQLAALEIGAPLPSVTLEGDRGGSVDGRAWESESLKGKVRVIFYVDPDEKDLNNPFSEALKAEAFDRSRFGSVAIINMAATWMPDFALDIALKKKQENYPDTAYVRDRGRYILKQWQIADDTSDIIITDRDGKVLYLYEGRIPEARFPDIISLIKEHL